jgi:hypothetical protein
VIKFIAYGICSYAKKMEFQMKGYGCFLVQLAVHLQDFIWVARIIPLRGVLITLKIL